MADGTTKPIDQIHVGDTVDNAPPGARPGSKDQTHKVTAVHVTHDDRAYTDVTVRTGSGQATITGTAYHLYWDATTHTWTQARQLRIGGHLQSTSGGQTVIVALHSYTTTMVTYNLTIDTLHTYYVDARQRQFSCTTVGKARLPSEPPNCKTRCQTRRRGVSRWVLVTGSMRAAQLAESSAPVSLEGTCGQVFVT